MNNGSGNTTTTADNTQWVKIKKKVHSKSYKNTFFDIFKSAKTHYGEEKKWDQNHENHT